MSVSSRSPTTRGCFAPVLITVSRCSGGSGLPATSGVTPVAVTMTWISDPLPGACPSLRGSVRSAFVATNSAPAATAMPPSASRP